MWISISSGFYIYLIDSFLFLECLSLPEWNTAWICYGWEGSVSSQRLTQYFGPNLSRWLWSMSLLLCGRSGHHFSRWFGRWCNPRLSWTALSNWFSMVWDIQISLDIFGYLTGYLPSEDWLILFSWFELEEPQPRTWHPCCHLNYALCSSLSPPCPLFHMLIRLSVPFPPSHPPFPTLQMIVVTQAHA